MDSKIWSKIAIAASLAAVIYAAPSKAQEHAVSTGVVQSEVKGEKKAKGDKVVKKPITAEQHEGANTASGKALEKPTVKN